MNEVIVCVAATHLIVIAGPSASDLAAEDLLSGSCCRSESTGYVEWVASGTWSESGEILCSSTHSEIKS